MLSKVAREDDNLLPRKKPKSSVGYAAEWKLWKGKKLGGFFLLGYNYFIFKTQGPPATISSQTHLKHFYGCPE